VADLGLDAALEATVDGTKAWTGQSSLSMSLEAKHLVPLLLGSYFDEELQGMADATGLPVREPNDQPTPVPQHHNHFLFLTFFSFFRFPVNSSRSCSTST
jgi:hypothetical protein